MNRLVRMGLVSISAAAVAACAVDGSEDLATAEAELVNPEGACEHPDWPADWMARQWVLASGCQGVVVGRYHVLTAASCTVLEEGYPVFTMSTAPFVHPNHYEEQRKVVSITFRNGVDPEVNDYVDSNGMHADLALVRVDRAFEADRVARMAWTYPGAAESGWQSGEWRMPEGCAFPDTWDLNLWIQYNETRSGNAVDGSFIAQRHLGDVYDQGAPYYHHGTVLGLFSGWVLDWAELRDRFTAVPSHLPWILQTMGYTGNFLSVAGKGIGAPTISSFKWATQPLCAYVCNHTSGCKAYEFQMANASTCVLKSDVGPLQPKLYTTAGVPPVFNF